MGHTFLFGDYLISKLFLSHFQSPEDLGYYTRYLNSADVRAAIHVGDIPYADGSTQVEMALLSVSAPFPTEDRIPFVDISPYAPHVFSLSFSLSLFLSLSLLPLSHPLSLFSLSGHNVSTDREFHCAVGEL